MACHWRIRHKLMLTLGLTAGIIALLSAGTLKGLLSYNYTRKSYESKLVELQSAMDVNGKIKTLDAASIDPRDPWEELKRRIPPAREALALYEQKLQETLERHRDPDKGYYEKQEIDSLSKHLDTLDRLILENLDKPSAGNRDLPRDVPEVRNTIAALVATANDLEDAIYRAMNNRSEEAKQSYQSSMAIVLCTSTTGLLLTVLLMRFFQRSVVYPIRDLMQGVGKVAQGEFEHRIELHSGDEMEDLAKAYNDMAGRLSEMYRDLAHQVNERSRQLVRSERLASVGFLAAGVAHEINNPLASIAFCSEALESRMANILDKASGDRETIIKYLRMIQEEAFRCKAITERLLEFSRGGERRREPTDLAKLVQSVLDVVQHLQTSKGKQIIFEPVNRLLAWVNAQEVKQVVLNLVVNALDSMDEDGKLIIMLAERDRMAEIVFADTGCGMSPEILENIFEPFFTRSRTGKGTGLGLAISHRVINQHGGEIEATSPGLKQGSTFTVRLPLKPAESVKEDTLGHAAAA